MSNYKMQEQDYKKLNKDMKIVFISAEFNRNFLEKQEGINQNFLKERGFNNIEKYIVPGAYEIPSFLNKVIKSKKPDLVICFGVVIRGETTHYEMVAGESARGIMDISLKNNTAIINAILTCENEEQVIARISETYAISGLNLLSESLKLK